MQQITSFIQQDRNDPDLYFLRANVSCEINGDKSAILDDIGMSIKTWRPSETNVYDSLRGQYLTRSIAADPMFEPAYELRALVLLKLDRALAEMDLRQYREAILDKRSRTPLPPKTQNPVPVSTISLLQDRILRDVEAHQNANRTYIDEGVQLLRLVQRAPQLFERQQPAEKRQLLNFLLSNCVWKDGTVAADYRQPFDLLAVAHQEAEALPGREGRKRPKLITGSPETMVSNDLSALWRGD